MAVTLEMDMGNAESETAFRARLYKALYSPRVETFITVLILLNAAVLAALTYQYAEHGLSGKWVQFLIKVDLAIVAVFCAEMCLKIYAGGTKFFKSAWNLFDFFVIAVGIFGTSYPLTVVRSLRVLRTLRIVTRVPSMRIVVESFLRALPGIGSVLTVMLLMIFVFSVIGTQLFGGIAPELFGSLHASAFTLFTVLTLEGWPDVAREVMPHSSGAWIFFVTFIAINSFAVLNLMIAVIINAMQKEYDMEAEEEREDILEEVQALRAELKAYMTQKTDVSPK